MGVPSAVAVTVTAVLADTLFNTVPVILGVRVTILGVGETVELTTWLLDTVAEVV